MDKSSGFDAITVWHNQPDRGDDMPLQLSIERAQSVAARARRQFIPPVLAILAVTVIGTLRLAERGTSTQFSVWILIVMALWAWPLRKAFQAYRIHSYHRLGDGLNINPFQRQRSALKNRDFLSEEWGAPQ